MTVIYHITCCRNWPPEIGVYGGDALKSEGFIHCSTAQQLIPVADRLFRGHTDLLVLVIDETRVQSKIVYENLEGGSGMFPHVYGPLDRDAVIGAVALEVQPDGTFIAPSNLLQLQI